MKNKMTVNIIIIKTYAGGIINIIP